MTASGAGCLVHSLPLRDSLCEEHFDAGNRGNAFAGGQLQQLCVRSGR